jgi:hypothetical protein
MKERGKKGAKGYPGARRRPSAELIEKRCGTAKEHTHQLKKCTDQNQPKQTTNPG